MVFQYKYTLRGGGGEGEAASTEHSANRTALLILTPPLTPFYFFLIFLFSFLKPSSLVRLVVGKRSYKKISQDRSKTQQTQSGEICCPKVPRRYRWFHETGPYVWQLTRADKKHVLVWRLRSWRTCLPRFVCSEVKAATAARGLNTLYNGRTGRDVRYSPTSVGMVSSKYLRMYGYLSNSAASLACNTGCC